MQLFSAPNQFLAGLIFIIFFKKLQIQSITKRNLSIVKEIQVNRADLHRLTVQQGDLKCSARELLIISSV
jgi:hypothetical protein